MAATASSASAPPIPSHLCLPRASFSSKSRSPFPLRLPLSPKIARLLVLRPPPPRTTPSTRIRAIHSLDPDFFKIPYVEGVPVGKKLKLWNLPPNCKHSELLEWFQGVNVTVESLEFTDDPKLNAQGISGFVELATKQHACIAIIRLDGAKFRGHYIRLDFAEKKPHSRDYGSRRNRSNNSGRARQFSDSRSQFQTSGATSPLPSAGSSLGTLVADTQIPASSQVTDSQLQSLHSNANSNTNAGGVQNHSGRDYVNGSAIGNADNTQATVGLSLPISADSHGNRSGIYDDYSITANVIPSVPSSSPAPGIFSMKANNSYSTTDPDTARIASPFSLDIKNKSSNQSNSAPGHVSPFSTDNSRDKMLKENPNRNHYWNGSQSHGETERIQNCSSSKDTGIHAFRRFGPMYGSPRPSSCFRVFVGNLDSSVDDASLQQLFSKYGTVLEARVLKESGRSRGVAIIAMSSAEEVKAAIKGLDGRLVGSSNVKVASIVP